jgi:hypothetical protein
VCVCVCVCVCVFICTFMHMWVILFTHTQFVLGTFAENTAWCRQLLLLAAESYIRCEMCGACVVCVMSVIRAVQVVCVA